MESSIDTEEKNNTEANKTHNVNRLDEDDSSLGLLHAKISELEKNGIQEEKDDKKAARQNKKQTQELKQFLTDVMNDNSSKEDQIKEISSKFFQLVGENRVLEKEMSVKNKKTDELIREKESLYSDLTKVNSIKNRLETLCRELQKQNKVAMDNSKRFAEEEQQQRQDLSKKFHEKINEITTKMEEQAEERVKLFKENEMLKEKLKNFVEQYEIREKHFETQMKAKDLELQLLEVKVKQQAQIAIQESAKDKAQLRIYEEQVVALSRTEKELRSQLALYAEKFEQFQETLTKSNDVFNTFKQEMERMSKR